MLISMNWPEMRDLIMRFSPAALALSATLALVSSVSFAQSTYQPTTASNELINLGQGAQHKGEFDAAYNFYESALVADPRNANAYIAMAQIAEVQGLPGKSIQLYTKALELDPNNSNALAGQGRAYVAKGAMTRADANLAKLQLICPNGCEQVTWLSDSIAAGPPKAVVTADAITPELKVEDAPSAE
jgi:tetratricopeptide (TPR) repeat protein